MIPKFNQRLAPFTVLPMTGTNTSTSRTKHSNSSRRSCCSMLFSSVRISQPATPAAEREAWRQATAAVAKDPEMLRQLETAGLELDHRDGKAFQDFLDADFKRVEAAVNRIGRVE